MVALTDVAAPLQALGRTEPQPFADGTSVQSARTPATRPDAPAAASGPSSRPFVPGDPAYLTVEPDGRDDIGFLDRLRDAIARVASNFASGDALAQSVERVVSEVSDALEGGGGSASVTGVQLRISSIDVAFTDDASGTSAFASVRQFALEVSVARGDAVAAEDVRVFTAEGRSAGLSVTDVRAGFTGGVYRRVETGGGDSALSEQARERLEAARAGLERVRAVQDALSAFRDGNEAPLRELFEGDSAIGQVFPGSGPLALNS